MSEMSIGKIQERFDILKRTVEKFERMHHRKPSGENMRYVNDVGYLLSFLTEHPASEPPDDDREVLIAVCWPNLDMTGLRLVGFLLIGTKIGVSWPGGNCRQC